MKASALFLAICTALIVQSAHADIFSDCEQILDDAQQVYPEFFPSNPETQLTEQWCFRHYAGTYLGVFLKSDSAYNFAGVYTLGGPFGNSPLYIDQTDHIINMLNQQLGKQAAVCNSNNIPKGFKYTREGDITRVTTQEGQCIELPDTQTICEPLPATTETGQVIPTQIHALSQNSISDLTLTGVDIALPGLPSIPDALKQELVNDQHCTIHAPSNFLQHQVHIDVCMDLTNQLGQFATYPGITPPVTMSFQGETRANKVDNCFKTDASTVTNLVTGQLWVNQNGIFVEVKE